ncbi:hypothetical protein LTR53_010995 [Teratosphaeriaceae sp. CCFEE 6253]|nr:hypothetical protein LTR53_010995 [Teratosphaeriaceae sp. CCFEE 6253]
MKLTAVLAFGALCLPYCTANTSYNCLSSSDANTLATDFGKLILTSDFIDYSESINTLKDNGGTSPFSLLGMAFTSRADFEAQSSKQPFVPFQVKNVWYNCNVITVRWLSAQSPQPVSTISHQHVRCCLTDLWVVGISVLQTVYSPKQGNPSNFQINEIWAE